MLHIPGLEKSNSICLTPSYFDFNFFLDLSACGFYLENQTLLLLLKILLIWFMFIICCASFDPMLFPNFNKTRVSFFPFM